MPGMIIEPLDAANGDAALVRHTSPSGGEFVGLVDGGPGGTFGRAIRPALETLDIPSHHHRNALEWVAVSHVDSDHIVGILDLVRAGIPVNRFLFNTPSVFPESGVITASSEHGTSGGIDARLSRLLASRNVGAGGLTASIPQGQSLLDLILQRGAHLLNLPTNRRLLTGDVCEIEGLTVTVVAPSQVRIDALLSKWEQEVGVTTASAERMDDSVTNLSSLAFVVSCDGRTALFTGDTLEDDIIAGLKATGHTLPLRVDVLKVPHHGSNSPTNPQSLKANEGLLENVIAEHYIVSSNGANNNPSLSTLERIITTQTSPCTVWLPGPVSTEHTPRAHYYKTVVADFQRLAKAAATKVTVRVGTGEPLVIDLPAR
jgi:beta-lactamase superfamily II metal-dependent hydrolase